MRANALLTRWGDDPGGWHMVDDEPELRIEATLGLGHVKSLSEAQRLAAGELARFVDGQREVSVAVDPDGGGDVPFVDWAIGDLVDVDGEVRRVVAMSVAPDPVRPGRLVYVPQVGDVIDSQPMRLMRGGKKMSNGTLGGASRIGTPLSAMKQANPANCCPPIYVPPCVELITQLETGGIDEIESIALHPDGDEIWAAESGAGSEIARYTWPGGDLIDVFNEGTSITFGDDGNLYWNDRYTDVGTDSHIRKGSSAGGSIIYSAGADWPLSSRWFDGNLYIHQNRRAAAAGTNQVGIVDDAGGGFTSLYELTDPEVNSELTITADGAIWFVGTNPDADDDAICRLPPGGGSLEFVYLTGFVASRLVPDGNDVLFQKLPVTGPNVGLRATYDAIGLEIDLTDYDCFDPGAHALFDPSDTEYVAWSVDFSLVVVGGDDKKIWRSNP